MKSFSNGKCRIHSCQEAKASLRNNHIAFNGYWFISRFWSSHPTFIRRKVWIFDNGLLALIFYLDLMSSEIAPAGDKDLPLILYVLYATAASLTYALLETIFWGKDTTFLTKACLN